MKKILVLIVSVLISFSIINISNANSLEKKIYKKTILSKIQIEKDYTNGKEYNKKISEIFAKLRYEKNINTLWKLEILLKGKIIELNSKNILSKNERKKLNLYNNLYYRTILLLDYNL